MADVLSALFTPHGGWAYHASFAVSMFVESSVGRDCGSRVQIWYTSIVAMKLPEGVYAGGREEDEV
jgi:hypothetical protein